MNGNDGLCCGCREPVSNHVDQSPRDQISGSRIDANLRDHYGSRFFGCLLVFLDHLGDVWYFTRDIEIMGAILSTSFEGMLAVEAVWSHGCNEDFRLLG